MIPTLDKRTRSLLLTLALGVFAGALDLSVLSPALPAIGREFAVPLGDLSWIFTLYLLANVASIAIAATLADRYGRRPVYLFCISLFAAGSALAIFSNSYPMFLVARALQALGAGGIFPVATAAIGDVIPLEKRGAALGAVAATWGAAAVLGPSIGGIVTHLLSWRWIFMANIPLATWVFLRALRDVPTTAPRVRPPLDAIGLVAMTAGLLAIVAGVTTFNPWLGATGAVVLLAFVLFERRIEHPIVPLSLFSTPQLAKTYGLELLVGILEGSLFFVPTVIVAAQHRNAIEAGAIAALGALAFVVVIPVSGKALDRIGSRSVLLLGSACTAAGLAIFAFGFTSLAWSIVAMLVAGFGFGALLGAPTRYIITNAAEVDRRSTALGFLSQALIVGQLIGGSLAGGLFDAHHHQNAGFREAYIAFVVVAVLALLLATQLDSRARERALARHLSGIAER
ncbi:MAG: MFS transporter [Candidatus Eremiobacteraeota bacterium]|nr:MFS transporter [Candidatus Eremiobacteraeota bacterium]